MNIVLKNIKFLETSRGVAFTASIYLDGKRVGTVENSGTGGCNNYHWKDDKAGKAITEHAESQPPLPSEHFPEGLPMDIDLFIDTLIEKQETEKQYKKWCKTKTVFRLKSTPEGECLTVARPYNPNIKKALKQKYGAELVEIINERF